jgi:serine/threonine protein kinase
MSEKRVSRFGITPWRSLGPHYDIIEFLGSGWEGEVFKVEERRTGIVRAAKIFYRSGGIREAPLLRYARKLHKLRSCSIVIQYHHRDTATIAGKRFEFLVSDYADGEMLSSFLLHQKKKRLPVFEALHLLYALVLGVEQIHFLGEYHGDIHSDNIMVKRQGLGFEVHLLDFFDLGRSTKDRMQLDVIDLINIFYEMIGGQEAYRESGSLVRGIVRGQKHNLIRSRFKTAGDLRLYLENLSWEEE